jgi:nicotinamide riboside transporter PnuC
MTLLILDILGLIFGVTGAVLVGNLNRYGFLCFFLGSTFHGSLGYLQSNYGLMLTCVIFICIDIYYFIKWKNNEKS